MKIVLRRPALRLVAAVSLFGCVSGCTGARPAESPLSSIRTEARTSDDPELAGRWLLAELISPGGSTGGAQKARARLEALGKGGMLASLARGLDDGLHGRLTSASDHYLEAVRAARNATDTLAPIVAWFSANRALSSSSTPDLWKKWQPEVETWIADPKSLGWRARSELAEWTLDQAWAAGIVDVDRRAIQVYGCLTKARIAGPFGHGAAIDAVRHFPPERPGPWSERWDPDPSVPRPPRVFDIDARSCAIQPEERVGEGIYYAEAFFELPGEQEVLLAVQGALGLFVDDKMVLDRDTRIWGVWPKFGVHLRLGPGRHRVVARLSEASTSFRLMRPDGTPLGIESTNDEAPGYSITEPKIMSDPNVLSRFTRDGALQDPGDDVARLLAAALAHLESSDDVASALVEPLISVPERATGPALSFAATFAEGDPIYESSQAKDLARALDERAAKKDEKLWGSRLSFALGVAEKKGAEEAVSDLQRLASEFQSAPEVQLALSRVYGELGWDAEHARAVKDLLQRFPNDLGALHAAIEVFDAEGDVRTVDDLLARVARIDRNDELALSRALLREDYAAAIAELERFARAHPDRDDLKDRISDIRVRAGKLEDIEKRVESAVLSEPSNPRARLDLADARLAAGKKDALYRALADSVEAGVNPQLIANAIDLVEGVTELAPYRLDARAIIEQYERSGRTMPGTAARILDYAALWIRSDGSSRMLEHEIVRVQSAEAIASFAEHRMLEGLPLHLRVLKKDGSTFEPELVPGKSTITFPHLEVGDYIETEQVVFTPGDGGGVQYNGPRWFFREENVGYARSEFLVIAPEAKELVVETTGAVPAPVVERRNGLVSRRFRVDVSPAAPAEPGSPPAAEFLPSVRVGWGVSLERRLRELGDAMMTMTPVDPRILRIAEHIVKDAPHDPIARARRLYRWLLDNVEPGEEPDGRRVVVGKRGNLWQGFRTLCRALGIDVRYAVAESRLAPPPTGPLSLATHFTQPVARVEAGKRSQWLTLGNKYAPFGYLPAEVRGMPAYWLSGGALERTVLPTLGSADAISFSGRGKLDATGKLTIDLAEEFSGKLAAAIRQGLSQVPEEQLKTVLESNLLAQAFRGGELQRFSIERREDPDVPLVIKLTAKVARFAQVTSHGLVISPPLTPDLGRLATLPSRKNPLLIGEGMHRRVELELELPKRSRVESSEPVELADNDRRVTVADATKGDMLTIRRTIDIPAGRVQPADYTRFARFAHQADDALSQQIQVHLP